MKYDRFEDLPVWTVAIELKLRIDKLCRRAEIRQLHNLVDQIDDAALSISNNIAEGFERGTTNDLLKFLYIARGSAGEVRSMLRYAQRRDDLVPYRAEIGGLIVQVESVSRQLRGWAKSLQDSDIRGQRFLTDDTRDYYDREQRARAFAEKIRADFRARFDRPRESQPSDSAESPS